MKVIIITDWILRIAALAALVLGLLFWTGNAETEGIRLVHMLLGIIVVLSLWTLGLAQGFRGGSFALALATFVVGLLLVIVGLYQTGWLLGSYHWIIQVIHLLLALIAIGLGEMITGRAKRQARTAEQLPIAE